VDPLCSQHVDLRLLGSGNVRFGCAAAAANGAARRRRGRPSAQDEDADRASGDQKPEADPPVENGDPTEPKSGEKGKNDRNSAASRAGSADCAGSADKSQESAQGVLSGLGWNLSDGTASSNLRFKDFLTVNMKKMSPSLLTIGALAKRTECNVPTIRYYEEIGLLPRARRRPGGHRCYSDADLQRLSFIRRCRDFGFPIEQVRDLLALMDNTDKDCNAARDVAQAHLDEVRRKLTELQILERSLAAFVKNCNAACAGGPASKCVILRDLDERALSSCCA
jgi:MerR family transcriptional regulator, copper efflux regulator